MRFPRYSVGLFVAVLALHLVVMHLGEHHCVGSFGNFRCDGWAGLFAGFVLVWHMFIFAVIPGIVLLAVVALVRLVQWQIRRHA
jgi:xanthine/uracil/vitamin C permease (AzgA family)